MSAYDYLKLWQLKYQTATLRKRIEGACLKIANDIINEAASTPNHLQRIVWAKNIFFAPGRQIDILINPVILNPAIYAAGELCTDDDIEFVISSEITARAEKGVLNLRSE